VAFPNCGNATKHAMTKAALMAVAIALRSMAIPPKSHHEPLTQRAE
jgi:hypothetical protein